MSEIEDTPTALSEALVVLHGGPHDGHTTTIGSHDELTIDTESGARYVRQDSQEGDHRVYRFDGEYLPTSTSYGPDPENRLHADLAQLAAERGEDEELAAE